MIHLSWVVSLQWPFHLYPTLAMVAGSCVPSGTPEALVCPPCGVTVQFSLRFSIFTFHPYLRFRCFGCCYAPSNSLQRSVCYVPILGTCLWCCLYSLTGLLSLCLRLTSALSRCRHCFCWLLPLPKWVGELQALSSMVTFVAGDDCLSYIPQLVTKSESLTRSFPRSFLVTSLADLQLVLITTSYYARSGLSACICFGPGLCLQVAIAFSCPLGALLALFYERGVVLLGEVIAAARAARPQVGSLRAHNVRSVSTSVAFHRHWSVASILDQPLGPPVRCFLNIILATFTTNLMVYFLLVTSWLRVLG